MFNKPAYLLSLAKGSLTEKVRQAYGLLKSCTLCPRNCGVDRLKEDRGFCSTGSRARVFSWNAHFGEEPQLVGTHGSGTIFFSRCNLNCIFCQNYDISVEGDGRLMDDAQLSEVMLQLQAAGCHNINLVTPSHVVPSILGAVEIAATSGLKIPLVYNSSGYDSLETLRLLDGIVDIYMPDFKFWEPETARICCDAPDYPKIAKKTVQEMFDQVGDLKTDDRGITVSGLLVRHLVMPGQLEETREIIGFLQKEVSADTHLNIMGQYRPMGKAGQLEQLSNPLSPSEYRAALKIARNSSLNLVR